MGESDEIISRANIILRFAEYFRRYGGPGGVLVRPAGAGTFIQQGYTGSG